MRIAPLSRNAVPLPAAALNRSRAGRPQQEAMVSLYCYLVMFSGNLPTDEQEKEGE